MFNIQCLVSSWLSHINSCPTLFVSPINWNLICEWEWVSYMCCVWFYFHAELVSSSVNPAQTSSKETELSDTKKNKNEITFQRGDSCMMCITWITKNFLDDNGAFYILAWLWNWISTSSYPSLWVEKNITIREAFAFRSLSSLTN